MQSGAFPTACSGGPAQGSAPRRKFVLGGLPALALNMLLAKAGTQRPNMSTGTSVRSVSLSTLVLPVTLPIVVVPPTRPLAATVNAQGSTHLYGDILRVGLTYKFGDYSTPW